MAHQREKPGTTIEQLNVTLGRPADSPGYCSGGRIENFREGWAHEALSRSSSRVAHWFNRDGFGEAVSLCGHWAPVRWLFGRGNYPCCQRCARMRNRMNSAARVG